MKKATASINLVLLSTFLGGVRGTADEPVETMKTEIVEAWRNYFQGFKSVKVNSRLVKESWAGRNLTGEVWKNQLTLKGSKYRYESKLPRRIRSQSLIINAYNGRVYQVLVGRSEPSLYQSQDLGGLYPYPGSAFPPMERFDFAFRKGEVQNLDTLQKPQTWQNVKKRITSMRHMTRNGQAGIMLAIDAAVVGERYEVFVQDRTYFPTYSRHVFTVEGAEEYVESETTKVTERKEGGREIIFPLLTVWKGYQDGKVTSSGFIEVDEKTLEINRSVKDEVFTIPATQAAYFTDKKGTVQVPQAKDKGTSQTPRPKTGQKGADQPLEPK